MLCAVSLSVFRACILAVLCVVVLPACHPIHSSAPSAVPIPNQEINPRNPDARQADRAVIPAIASKRMQLPPPESLNLSDQSEPADRYTVVVTDVPVTEVLYSLARESQEKIDVIGEIEGDLSLSVFDQTLEYILDEIASQASLRLKVSGNNYILMTDKPFLRNYELDYLNMQRVSESRVDLATQVGTISTDIGEGGTSQSGTNGSRLFVENKTEHSLWDSVTASIGGIVEDSGDKLFVNRESGIISVMALASEHRSIQSLLDDIVDSARRQVLIEATVVEVTLNDSFESGVDWRILGNGFGGEQNSLAYSQILSASPEASSAVTAGNVLLSFTDSGSALGNISATLNLLQQFGEVQVLSSPKIIAMNNQPAILKVVDNRVYFTFEVDRMQRENGDESTVVDSTVHSVPVGLVMNVTPFINKREEVVLNIRPTISRILNFAEDPSPALAGQNQIRNLIPEIQVREMESLLRVQSGEMAIIGGLMQNKIDQRTTGVPGLTRLPWLGKVFSQETKLLEKTELLVFLRPTVVNRSSDIDPREISRLSSTGH